MQKHTWFYQLLLIVQTYDPKLVQYFEQVCTSAMYTCVGLRVHYLDIINQSIANFVDDQAWTIQVGLRTSSRSYVKIDEGHEGRLWR